MAQVATRPLVAPVRHRQRPIVFSNNPWVCCSSVIAVRPPHGALRPQQREQRQRGDLLRAAAAAGAMAGDGGMLPQAAGGGATGPAAAAAGGKAKDKAKQEQLPFQQRVLNSILNVSNVPYRCVSAAARACLFARVPLCTRARACVV
jgi:hypothetical protein